MLTTSYIFDITTLRSLIENSLFFKGLNIDNNLERTLAIENIIYSSIEDYLTSSDIIVKSNLYSKYTSVNGYEEIRNMIINYQLGLNIDKEIKEVILNLCIVGNHLYIYLTREEI